jgi:hypothetical protein
MSAQIPMVWFSISIVMLLYVSVYALDICNFMLCGLINNNISSKASFFVNLHEVAFGRLLNIPGIVKLWESPRQSRGFAHD